MALGLMSERPCAGAMLTHLGGHQPQKLWPIVSVSVLLFVFSTFSLGNVVFVFEIEHHIPRVAASLAYEWA